MQLDLAERLVCPAAHARTPLIVLALETRGRELWHGSLGCMMCRRAGTVRDGAVYLLADATVHDAVPAETSLEPRETALDRLEALLGLAEPGARVLLAGRYAVLAGALAARSEATVVVLNAAAAGDRVASLWVDVPVVPLSDATFAAAAIDATVPEAQRLDVSRVVRSGGRIVATADVAPWAGVRELARDAFEWVGESLAATPVVPLRRA